ncbi:MAG: hypothetical protein E7295_03615 [Lachnospiraceae bacterium]|jgi:hypothetical protein|nr:hypothetical protein [Lachnospiraceae bacterium]
MENRELDAMLKQSLQPAIQAEESLDRAILERLADPSDAGGDGIGNDQAGNGMTGKGIKGRAFQRNLPKAAAIVLAILVIGTGTVYAAGYIYNKIIVTDHGVSIGNEEYIIDEELAKPVEYAPVEEVATQEPGEGDQWLSMKKEKVSGQFFNTYYTYPDYQTAIGDTRFESLFTELPGKEQGVFDSVIYSITEEDGDVISYSLDACFDLEDKIFCTHQMMADEGFTEDDAFGVSMQQTGNVRTYLSGSGTEFTLVDDLEREQYTIVLIFREKDLGYLSFQGFSEEEIHHILDLVKLP